MNFEKNTKTRVANTDTIANKAGRGLGDLRIKQLCATLLVLLICVVSNTGRCGDLDEVLKAGKLRHLGIVYANFVTEDKTGLDVELMQLFAAHLGVKYEFVETNWTNILTDLTGKVIKPKGDDVEIMGTGPIRGDIIATGFTMLEWRKKVVDFSEMTFPTGVWLLARADSKLQPIVPTNTITKDIEAVRKNLKDVSILGLQGSCLDPSLYNLDTTGASIQLFPIDRDLSEMIPSMMAKQANTTLMDLPVALIALEDWPGQIKVIGPISDPQIMACAFPKTSPKLRQEFNNFFNQCKADGTYKRLVEKYYSSLFVYYPDSF
ncbi:transporter substrate-binding domain-containing protein [Desulforhopalus sp. IMCC35007]|uniref:transporter substrate-binding domain-containing protein n=1 Tax=Desulforhopalus sp. IMCC35007 TaxID=2569543 RepID=UPI0010AE4269|nr:transporter substrate-binding domain-containing protein [Desulforhopalus sp. IMCC35007]TKB07260.1 transporter substrate-binding domain-containing protein [Desulforhopalus sp. IMCC35007]